MFWSRTTLLLLLAIGCGRLKFDPSALDNDAGTGVLEDAGNDAQVTSSCPPPGSGAIAWYTFDEPADLAADQLGLHSGTVQNGVPIQAGSLPGCGSALQFPSDSFLELPDSDDWDSMQSLSLWVRVDVAPPDTAAIISRDAGGTAQPGHLSILVTPDLYFISRYQYGGTSFACSAPVALGEWSRLVFNLGPPQTELKVNGQAADPSLAFDYPNPNLSVSGSCGAADSMSMGANDNPWTVGIGSYNSSEGLADVVHDGFAYGLLDNLVVSENRQ